MAGRTITETDVVAFASLTGDLHPQHIDAVWAGQSPFGERIAHGMLVLSYALGMVSLDPERIVALRGLENIVFKRPVRIGDTIGVEIALLGTDDRVGLEHYELRIRNQLGQLVARAVLKAVIAGESAPAAQPASA